MSSRTSPFSGELSIDDNCQMLILHVSALFLPKGIELLLFKTRHNVAAKFPSKVACSVFGLTFHGDFANDMRLHPFRKKVQNRRKSLFLLQPFNFPKLVNFRNFFEPKLLPGGQT